MQTHPTPRVWSVWAPLASREGYGMEISWQGVAALGIVIAGAVTTLALVDDGRDIVLAMLAVGGVALPPPLQRKAK